MKRKFTLSIMLLLAGYLGVFATGPTLPATRGSFSSVEGNRFTYAFDKGNGDSRIVVVREAVNITASPVNQVDYNANAVFETPNTEFTNAEGYVVLKNNSTSSSRVSVTVTNLKPNTKYYVSVFDYNGTGTGTEYLTIPLNDSIVTKAAPTQPAQGITFSVVAGNKVTLKWQKGNGDKRTIIARKGAPVNAVPQDLKAYRHIVTFGTGDVINNDNYVVYDGTGAEATVYGLEPNTTYYFSLFEANGSSYPVYLTPGTSKDQLTNAGPTQASGNITFTTVEGTSLRLSFGAGNGMHQLIIVRKGQAVTAVPVNGRTYTPDTEFGKGEAIEEGQFVINTLLDNKTVTHLDPGTVYHFRVYDYDVTNSGYPYYLTSSYSQKEGSTAATPTAQAKNARFEGVSGSGATLKFDAGVGGGRRLVVMKEGGPVDAEPADLVRYSGGSAAFRSGSQLTPGNYIMADGMTGTQLSVTGLTPGATYHAAVFEFSGNNAPMYARPGATAVMTVPNEPTARATNFNPNTFEGNSFRIGWTGGNGVRRLVIARKGAAVTAFPQDGTTYTPDNNFGNGPFISEGQFVVHDGEDRQFTLKNLEIGTVYHLAIFEYNVSGAGPDYLVSSFLAGSSSTVVAPVSQATVTANNIQANQATINYAVGTGAGRIFIIRANAPVNVTPQDLTYYASTNTHFGTASTEIGTGNYIVYRTGGTSTFTVTDLAPNTQYHIAVFEYNGSSAPVYKVPGGTHSFTTAAAGIPPPTSAGQNPRLSVVEGNRLTFAWDEGNGEKRIVVMRQGAAVNFTPANGSTYTHNAEFSKGTDLGGGQYIVYNSGSGAASVTNILPNTTYHFAVYEYNGTGTNTSYLMTPLTYQAASASTPAAGVTDLAATPGSQSIEISWTNGPGKGRLIVMKEGGNVTATPADLTKYVAAPKFKDGVQIAAGEFVVYSNTGSSVTVTGLDANKTYHFTIFEYNGADAPVYNVTNKLSSSATTASTLPLKWAYFTAKESNEGIKLEWGTTEEQNTHYFVVERGEATGFVSLDTIAAKGSLLSNHYSFTDKTNTAARVTYRIKQVDNNTRFEYSKQVTVEVKGKVTGLRVYPNPAQGQCRISLPAGSTRATVQLYDVRGILVKSVQVSDKQVMGLEGIVPGVYHVVVNDHSERYSQQLIVK